jgi:hypothetical protein
MSAADRADPDDLDDPAMAELMHSLGAAVRSGVPLFAAPQNLAPLRARLARADREFAGQRPRTAKLWLATAAVAAVLIACLLLWRRPVPTEFDLQLYDSRGVQRTVAPIFETPEDRFTIALDLPMAGFVRILTYDGTGEVFPLGLDASGTLTKALRGAWSVTHEFAAAAEQDLVVLVTTTPLTDAQVQAVFPEFVAEFAAPARLPTLEATLARARSELGALVQHRRLRRRE